MIESFWRAFRARARFDPTRSFGAWMRQIATRAALDHLRTLRRRAERQLGDIEQAAPAGSDLAARDAIERAFRRLSPKLQIVATLALLEEWSVADISGVLDLPIGTVKSRLSRATAGLRKELTREGIRP